MEKDSIGNTFKVAIGVCLVCSFLVSSAAIGLRDLQRRNRMLDIKRNIVEVAGFSKEEIRQAGGVESLFESRFEHVIINLNTGERALDSLMDAMGYQSEEAALAKYDQIKASKKTEPDDISQRLDKEDQIAGFSRRETYSHVYIQRDAEGAIQKYIFPVRGKGLWSMLKGFVALETDFQTIAGLTFYEHGETPGLGGEVDNPDWKQQWDGKKVYPEQSGGEIDRSQVEVEVVKGSGSGEYEVDGLSGATITSRGVTNLLRFWLGENGFKPFIDNEKAKFASSPFGFEKFARQAATFDQMKFCESDSEGAFHG